MNLDNLLFASVNLPIIDKSAAVAEILPLIDNYKFWDPYRAITMIPLMTKTGTPGLENISNRFNGEFVWANYAPTIIKDYFEHIVFPWLGQRSRLMILITQPGESNAEHIDCKLHEIGARKHKFRIVLQGKVDTLYFKTTEGNIFVPEVPGAFLMDGSWVHGMTNSTDEIKITLALGSPWRGLDNYANDVELLLDKRDYTMPKDLTPFIEKPGGATYI
jgi:hypothetical protein